MWWNIRGRYELISEFSILSSIYIHWDLINYLSIRIKEKLLMFILYFIFALWNSYWDVVIITHFFSTLQLFLRYTDLNEASTSHSDHKLSLTMTDWELILFLYLDDRSFICWPAIIWNYISSSILDISTRKKLKLCLESTKFWRHESSFVSSIQACRPVSSILPLYR